MYTYEISREKTTKEVSTLQTKTLQGEVTKEELLSRLNKHYVRFWAEIGDQVRFKRPKKGGEFWTVIGVETDPEKVQWANGGWIPNYIHLESTTRRHATGQAVRVWTCENKLRATGVKSGKISGSR